MYTVPPAWPIKTKGAGPHLKGLESEKPLTLAHSLSGDLLPTLNKEFFSTKFNSPLVNTHLSPHGVSPACSTRRCPSAHHHNHTHGANRLGARQAAEPQSKRAPDKACPAIQDCQLFRSPHQTVLDPHIGPLHPRLGPRILVAIVSPVHVRLGVRESEALARDQSRFLGSLGRDAEWRHCPVP